MFEFKKYFDDDEKILYQGKPNPKKGSKGLVWSIFWTLFFLMVLTLMLCSVFYGFGDGINGFDGNFIVVFLFVACLEIWAIYHLVYTLLFRRRDVSDELYCITNKRVFKYELTKNKISFGYLINYESIICYNIKDNFGDISFDANAKDNISKNQKKYYIKWIPLTPNPENMPEIIFRSVEHPDTIVKIAESARNNKLKSNND